MKIWSKQNFKDVLYVFGLIGFILFCAYVYTSDWGKYYKITFHNGTVVEGNCGAIENAYLKELLRVQERRHIEQGRFKEALIEYRENGTRIDPNQVGGSLRIGTIYVDEENI